MRNIKITLLGNEDVMTKSSAREKKGVKVTF